MGTMEQLQPLWGSWNIVDFIGEGGYGKVYKAVKMDRGGEYFSAIKHIQIPHSEEEVLEAKHMGMDDRSVYQYFDTIASRIISEIQIMYNLRGNSNIVAYEDHEIIHENNTLQWDVLIRMELLEPLTAYVQRVDLTARDVCRLGMDICSALAVCATHHIIHRDVKEGNIFISREGTFKLGDFGIARNVLELSSGMSMRGTPAYIAPEVYTHKQYNATVDIYSLGILMYKYLNDGRYPFLPPYPQPVNIEDSEQALSKRLMGEPLAPPSHGSTKLKEIVLKACSFLPEDRYATAADMLAALAEVAATESEEATISYAIEKKEHSAAIYLHQQETAVLKKTDAPVQHKNSRKKRWLPWCAAIGSVAAIAVCAILLFPRENIAAAAGMNAAAAETGASQKPEVTPAITAAQATAAPPMSTATPASATSNLMSEKYPVRTYESDGVTLQVEIKDYRSAVLTVTGIKLQDTYQCDLSTSLEDMLEYAWRIGFSQYDNVYQVATSYWTQRPGIERIRSLQSMQTNLWKQEDNDTTSTIGDCGLSVLPNGLSFDVTIPEQYEIDFYTLTEYSFEAFGVQDVEEQNITFLAEHLVETPSSQGQTAEPNDVLDAAETPDVQVAQGTLEEIRQENASGKTQRWVSGLAVSSYSLKLSGDYLQVSCAIDPGKNADIYADIHNIGIVSWQAEPFSSGKRNSALKTNINVWKNEGSFSGKAGASMSSRLPLQSVYHGHEVYVLLAVMGEDYKNLGWVELCIDLRSV